MSKEKIVIIIFIALVSLLFVSNWAATSYMKSQVKNIQPQNSENQTSSEKNTPLSIEEIIKESSYKTLKTADQKLSIKCPIDWVEIEEEKVLKYFDQKLVEQYQIKIPLVAAKKDGAQIIVMEVFTGQDETIDDVFNINEEMNKKSGMEVNVLKQEKKDGEIYFEAEYTQDGKKTASKEKILEGEENQEKKHFYIISIAVPSDQLKNYQEAEDEMLRSIQINN